MTTKTTSLRERERELRAEVHQQRLDLVRELLDAGNSPQQIAAELSVKPPRVKQLMRELGWRGRDEQAKRDEQIIAELHSGQSVDDVAEHHGVSTHTIRRVGGQAGAIPPRNLIRFQTKRERDRVRTQINDLEARYGARIESIRRAANA